MSVPHIVIIPLLRASPSQHDSPYHHRTILSSARSTSGGGFSETLGSGSTIRYLSTAHRVAAARNRSSDTNRDWKKTAFFVLISGQIGTKGTRTYLNPGSRWTRA
eukprot:3741514-Rhodomonas_salina.1